MHDVPRVVWTLAAGRFVNAAGSFVYFFLFLYLTGPRDVPLGAAGLLTGAVGAGMLLGNFTGGWFGDRFGHRRIMLASCALVGLLTLAVPWSPVAVLAGSLPLIGYANAVTGVSQGALVALAVPTGDRRRSVAINRTAFNAGCVIGPPLGALLSTYDFTALFVVDGAVTLLVGAVTARLLPLGPRVATATGGGPGLWQVLRADRALLVLLPAIVAVDLVYRQLYATMPVYLRDHGQPVGLYAALIALGSGMILCLELPAAIALRRLPALGIVGAGYGIVGLGFGVFSFGAATGIVVTAMVVITIGEILYKTTATAYVLDAAPDHLVGRYQGLYSGAATSGTILAPPVGALVYGAVPDLLWPGCAAVAIGAALLAWWSGRFGSRASTGPAAAIGPGAADGSGAAGGSGAAARPDASAGPGVAGRISSGSR